jgi:hypothetical protein
MGPLNLVNWRRVNAGFCSAMWLLAFLLAVLVLAHGISASSAAAQATLKHPPPRILH